MSHGAVVHASIAEREQAAEQRAVEARRKCEARYAWAAEHLPDLPADWVVVALGMLRFARVDGITTELVRERTEWQLRRFFTGAEIAAMKANGGELPNIERTPA